MSTGEYRALLQEQLRCPEAWLEQASNVLYGVSRLLRAWLTLTIIWTSGLIILALIALDFSEYSIDVLQEALRATVTLVAVIAALVCVGCNAGRFRSVFKARAQGELQWKGSDEKDQRQ